MDNISLLTCTFNNNNLTTEMLKTFFKKANMKIPIFIMDNGTIEIFKNKNNFENITIFDNSNYKWTKKYDCPSKTHAESINYALNNVITTDYVILCDNDIIFKKDINILCNEISKYDVIGQISCDNKVPPERLLPYFCIINIRKMKEQQILYNRYIGNGTFDTGCSFLQDIQNNKWNIKNININEYVFHLKGTTLYNKEWKKFYNNT